ncbi:TPA: endolytic transglycosylase MltG [Patescibacteria group bacterium]|uniref:Endolytic murein transglycosylase n=2 Tax=Bacteria division Kazan-3B-28 TaxID=1798534 RepID=A0A0G1KT19_UNCK3|nr:MAG: Aminodeoxychorismate lyase [candidate division Kazan bacterium GW2011_GWA1_44_22]KKT86713.1 MAG: Aminodeoxychorismate lyase [candidate division Kazan bacterium GW2011_GWB1_45_10]HAR54810.1 endolytic transglycosylase MltG [Patescibacteria group bacterium]HCR42262.1 endolytic transglycosylase MltG [Patescibacteria group bacterium]
MKRIGWFYLGGGLLIVGLCSGFYFWLFAPISRAGTPQLFTVQSAESITSIARRLEEGQLIRSAWGFKAYLKISGKVVVQPGTYEISTKDSLIKIANLIASGDTTNVTLTIPEGYTLAQIAEQVGQKNIADAAEFTRLVKDFPPDYEFLKVRPTGQTSLEGFLFPDTYRLIKGNPTLAIQQILDNFSSKYTTDIKPKLGDKNLYEIITVASLIEREVKTTEDMVMVSGVIYNRLKIGMKLDIDATVRFIINNWKDPLTRDDLSVDSPYNTRRYAGLPPGPICNPGLAAIEAALQPADHDYYYYLTDYDGVTHYAKTLAEHNQNKLQYLL